MGVDAKLTSLQRKAVEAILTKIRMFAAQRYSQVRRMNPKVEYVWEDLQWQMLASLKVTLSGDKAFGPTRFHVAEVLLGDDNRKIREFFSPKSQQSLLGEIVAEKETDSHRTAGSLEIHDMRSLLRRIDPSLEAVATLLQTFFWWDLEDAAILARFDKKVNMVAAFDKNGITPEMASYYMELVGTPKRPTAEEVIAYELRMLKQNVEAYRLRREEEPAYQMIICRERGAQETPEFLVDVIHSQQTLLKSLRAGAAIDDVTRQQLAKVMKCEPSAVAPERAIPVVENMIRTNHDRLGNALAGGAGGTPYNMKLRLLSELEERFNAIAGDRLKADAPEASA